MTKKNIVSTVGASGAHFFRVRMVYNKWEIHLLKEDGSDTGFLMGPYSDHAEATEAANKTGLKDADKSDLPIGRSK